METPEIEEEGNPEVELEIIELKNTCYTVQGTFEALVIMGKARPGKEETERIKIILGLPIRLIEESLGKEHSHGTRVTEFLLGLRTILDAIREIRNDYKDVKKITKKQMASIEGELNSMKPLLEQLTSIT